MSDKIIFLKKNISKLLIFKKKKNLFYFILFGRTRKT